MAEPMSDARLEQLAGLAELPCTCRDAECGNFTSALTATETRELVLELRRTRQQLAAIGPTHEEWGYGDAPERITTPLEVGYRNGTPEQRVRAAARHSRTKAWKRLAGDWHEVEQESEDA